MNDTNEGQEYWLNTHGVPPPEKQQPPEGLGCFPKFPQARVAKQNSFAERSMRVLERILDLREDETGGNFILPPVNAVQVPIPSPQSDAVQGMMDQHSGAFDDSNSTEASGPLWNHKEERPQQSTWKPISTPFPIAINSPPQPPQVLERIERVPFFPVIDDAVLSTVRNMYDNAVASKDPSALPSLRHLLDVGLKITWYEPKEGDEFDKDFMEAVGSTGTKGKVVEKVIKPAFVQPLQYGNAGERFARIRNCQVGISSVDTGSRLFNVIAPAIVTLKSAEQPAPLPVDSEVQPNTFTIGCPTVTPDSEPANDKSQPMVPPKEEPS